MTNGSRTRLGGSLLALSLLVTLPVVGEESPGENWRDPPEAAAPEPDPTPIEGTEVLQAIPDLVSRPWPPPLDLLILFGGHMPFQVVGAGLGISGFPTDWLRLSAVYSGGLSVSGEDSYFSSYAEGIASFKLFGIASGSLKDVYEVEPTYFMRPRPKPVMRVRVSSHHGFLVDVGAFAGNLALQRCVASCELAPESQVRSQRKRQLVYAFGGLRYLFYTDARSKRRPLVNRVAEAHFFAHAIARPLNDWAPADDFGTEPINRKPLGFRVGFLFPTCRTPGCPGAGLTLGYLPSPGTWLAAFSLGG
jgi:hypothetical protein